MCKTFNMNKMESLPGANYGLNIVLSSNRNDTDYICKGPVQGFKYKLHPSNEFPNFQQSYERIPIRTDVMAKVQPKITFNRDPNCSGAESRNECLRKCTASYLLNKCGCVAFYMPHDDETSICNQHENLCVHKALDEFSINVTMSSDFPCNCQLSCKSVSYETSVNFAEYDFANVIRAYNEDLDEEFPSTDMSRLTIYFEQSYVLPQVVGSKSILRILVQSGGIFAFLLCCFVWSLVEMCYVCSRKKLDNEMNK